MSKSKNSKENSSEEFYPAGQPLDMPEPKVKEVVEIKAVEPVETKPEVKAKPMKAKRVKRINFVSYVRTKGVRATHIPGLQARCKNPKILRTREEWDKFFSSY